MTKLGTPLKIQPAFLIFAGIILILIGIVSNVAPDLMLGVLAVLLWLFSFLLLVRLGSFKVLSPGGLFFIFYTLFVYIGGLYLFFTNGEEAPFSSGQRNYQFYLAITLGLLAFSVGTFFSNLYTKYRPKEETVRFRQKPWRDNLKGEAFAISLALLTLIAVVFTLIYVHSRGVLPLLQALVNLEGGDVYQASISARLQFTGYGEGGASYFYQGYFGQFYRVVLPFAALFALAKYLSSRDKRWLTCWLALSLITAFFLLLSLQRWPILTFVILTFLLYQFYQLRIQKKPIILVALFCAIAYFSVTYIRGFTVTILLREFSRRILLGQITCMYSLFELFPKCENFRYGGFLLHDFWCVLPGPGQASGTWLMQTLYPGSPTGASTTMGMIGGLYADFGQPGVVIGMLLFGFLMQLVFIWFVRSKKSLIALVLLSFFTISAGWLSFGGIVNFLFLYLVGAVICAVVIIVLSSILRIKPGGGERSVI